MSQIDGKIGKILKTEKSRKRKIRKTEKSRKIGKIRKKRKTNNSVSTNQNRKKHCELMEKFTREWKFPISTLQRNINQLYFFSNLEFCKSTNPHSLDLRSALVRPLRYAPPFQFSLRDKKILKSQDGENSLCPCFDSYCIRPAH